MNKPEHPNSLFCCQRWEWEQPPNNPDHRAKCLLQPQLQLVNAYIVSVAAAGEKTLSRFPINCVPQLGLILFLQRNCSLKVSLKWIQSNSKSRKTFNDNFEDPWLSDSLKRTNVWVELKGMFFPNWAFYLPPLTN